MKKNAGNSMRLGIFVFAAIALLITGIYFIGQKQQLFSNTFHIKAMFKNVNGLQIGNNVRFAGINIGTVDKIQMISDTAVRVSLVIDEDSRKFIRKDASAIIGSDGLMGDKLITIAPGDSGDEIRNNDFIQTTQPISMDDIMAKFKIAADEVADILDQVHSGRGTIGKLLMDSSFAKNINQTVTNLKTGSSAINADVKDVQKSFMYRTFVKHKSDSTKAQRKQAKENK